MSSKPDSTREVMVKSENGLHMIPCSKIVQAARGFSCDVLIRSEGKTADAKNMFDLLALAAEQGSSLALEATGEDAADAVEALVKLFESKFEVEDQQGPG